MYQKIQYTTHRWVVYWYFWNWHLTYISCHFSIVRLKLLYTMWFLIHLRISWYIKDFFNYKLACMSRHSKGGNFFSKYMDKGLLCYYVYGYCKIIVNVSKKINTLLACCVASAFHIWLFFHTWQINGDI
jgi:hypothetical protein